MVEFEAVVKKDRIHMRSVGHCSKEVCIAASAFINALVEKAEDAEERQLCAADIEYQRGRTRLDLLFKSVRLRKRFCAEIDGLLYGLSLLADTYPFEVRAKIVV